MNTLTKFGVPMGGGTGRGGILSPKLKWRFRVRFINFGPLTTGMDLSQNVVSVDRPSQQTPPGEVHSYNSRSYYAGKPEWQAINLVVRDDVTNVVSRLVGHQVQKQMNHFEQTAFMAGVNYKFTMIIEGLDGGNDGVLETWTLEGCFLTSVKYDEFDYTNTDGHQTIQMEVRYDNATLSDGLFTETPSFMPGVKVG